MYGYNTGLDSTIGRLSFIADGNTFGDAGTHLEDYTYLGLGTVVKRAHPNGADLSYIHETAGGDANDIYQGLDRFGRVVDHRWTAGGNDIERFKFGYDQNGNPLYQDNTLNNSFDELYHADGANGYDGLDRLTNFERGALSDSNSDGVPDTVTTNTRSQSWTLDALGNWTSSSTNGTSTSRTHNFQNQVTAVGSNTLTYDKNGNTTKDETGKYFVYDAWNRLVEVTNSSSTSLITYTYDALGRRIAETPASGTPKHLYYSDQWQVLEERENAFPDSAAPKTQYVWSPVYVDALVLRDQVSGTSGTPDTDFGGDGTMIAPETSTPSLESGYALAAQPDGKIVLAGTFYNGDTFNFDIVVARYNPNGYLDGSFGSNGVATFRLDAPGGCVNEELTYPDCDEQGDWGPTVSDELAYDVALQSTGKIVVAGRVGGSLALVRFNTDGSLDTGFGSGGYVTGSGDEARAIAIRPSDDKIIVAGQSGSNWVLARYSVNGANDWSYTTDVGSGSVDYVTDLVLQGDGKIVVSGYIETFFPYVKSGAVLRYDSSGSLDTSFATSGKLITTSFFPWGLAIQSDGKTVAAGTNSSDNFAVARFTTGGSFDTTFSSNGIAEAFTSSSGSFNGITVQPHGKLVAVGGVNSDFGVARFNSDGSLDTGFDGGDGMITTDVGSSTGDTADDVLFVGGRIIAGGWSNYDFSLAAYHSGVLGHRLFAIQDENYNVTALADTIGTIVERYAYDPYGTFTVLNAGWSPDGDGASNFSWLHLHQGGRFDTLSGLYHFRNRDYSPTLGRWTRQDPMGYVDGMSLYEYVRSAPGAHLDPQGLWGEGGHFYTVYMAGYAAGLDRERAWRLAFYSQMPDEYSKFDAIWNTKAWVNPRLLNEHFDNNKQRRQYSKDVGKILHSLHGGSPAQVKQRRDCLADILKRNLNAGRYNDWELGFLIHALGDSYSHTKANGSQYKFERGGHGPHLHEPDLIGGFNRIRYHEYVDKLYDALAPAPRLRTGESRFLLNLIHKQGEEDFIRHGSDGTREMASLAFDNGRSAFPGGRGAFNLRDVPGSRGYRPEDASPSNGVTQLNQKGKPPHEFFRDFQIFMFVPTVKDVGNFISKLRREPCFKEW